MSDLRTRLAREVLPLVREPAQYIGGELNMVEKDHEGRTSFALVFPDTYTIGMSHLGLRILYDALNRHDDIVCERAFAVEEDMEEQLRKKRIPLYALESFRSLSEFDIVGFSLPIRALLYERTDRSSPLGHSTSPRGRGARRAFDTRRRALLRQSRAACGLLRRLPSRRWRRGDSRDYPNLARCNRTGLPQ
ncbi:MAG: hypothetical protein U5N86_09725 [Planctomycetota bacterium]|nr:hypothetical protein [Planctomycetota bacterium]